MSHTAFGDAVGGLNGCAAVLTALIHARLTGKGQFIDLAQIECMMPFAAPWIIAHSIDGKAPVKYGNRHPDFVPHGCFPCAGADNWIVVAVSCGCDVAEARHAARPRRLGFRSEA